MSQYVKDSIKSRLKYNREIILELSKIVEENPTMRFGQILHKFVIPNMREYQGIHHLLSELYTEEPSNVLARIGNNKND